MAQWESLSNYQSTKTRWMPLSNVSVPLAICVLRASWCGPWRWGPRRCLAGQLRMGYVSFSWIVWANMFRNMMDCVDVCFLWNIMEYLVYIYIYMILWICRWLMPTLGYFVIIMSSFNYCQTPVTCKHAANMSSVKVQPRFAIWWWPVVMWMMMVMMVVLMNKLLMIRT